MCTDFQALNANMIIDRYPLAYIDNILDRLGGFTVFLKINLAKAYHQVKVAESDQNYTAL